MILKAFAKINLGLDVLRQREDGYHDVKMIMQTVRMYDQIEMHKTDTPGISLSCSAPFIPCDQRNLVYRSAQLMMEEYGITGGVSIHLGKTIPVSAGLAGGSSDAAAAMVGMNLLFRLGLSENQLMKLAVNIGADVPYCIMRGTALAEGIGEKLTPLPALPKCYVLLGKPGISVSTKQAYDNLDLSSITNHPDIDGMISDLEHQDLYRLASKMSNVFEPGIAKEYPVIRKIKELMLSEGALNSVMSGSGPTVFGIFDSEDKLKHAALKLHESTLARTVFAAEIFNRKKKEKRDPQKHDK